MEGEQQEVADKPFEPTPKRLDDLRRRGDVASSSDLTTSAAYLGLLVAVWGFGAGSILALSEIFAALLYGSADLSRTVFQGGGKSFLTWVLGGSLLAISVWFGLPAAGAILCIIVQRSLVFAPEKIQPKMSRISMISNAGKKFGISGLVEFSKSTAKLLIYSIALFYFVWLNLNEILFSLQGNATLVTREFLRLSTELLVFVCVISAVISLLDFSWQKFDFLRRNRMSYKELKDETKESEGDPWIKGARRQRATDIATNRMLSDVPSATVVIVNPTHYAVALKWVRETGGAPVCVAKGVDDIAMAIRERAMLSGVPIRRDPATARALHGSVAIGEEISPNHYKAVAAAIRFAESMRRKVGRTSGPRR